MSGLMSNKKFLLATILAAALIAGSLVAATSFASAQNATTSLFGNNSSSSRNTTGTQAPGPFGNNGTITNNTQAATPGTIVGSINVKQAARDFLSEKVKVTLAEASSKAESQVANGKAITGRLCVVQDFLVYTITVANMSNGTTQKVIVDAGNGSVLSLLPARQASGSVMDTIDGSFGDGGYHYHHHHHHHSNYYD
jgi:uncharacterized membrane protein YkoI